MKLSINGRKKITYSFEVFESNLTDLSDDKIEFIILEHRKDCFIQVTKSNNNSYLVEYFNNQVKYCPTNELDFESTKEAFLQFSKSPLSPPKQWVKTNWKLFEEDNSESQNAPFYHRIVFLMKKLSYLLVALLFITLFIELVFPGLFPFETSFKSKPFLEFLLIINFLQMPLIILKLQNKLDKTGNRNLKLQYQNSRELINDISNLLWGVLILIMYLSFHIFN